MKKTIAILLVAILAVGSVFALDASLSGKFTSQFAYDFDKNWVGFTEEDNDLNLKLALSTATENEGDVYAVIKAEMNLAFETSGANGAAQTEDDLLGVGVTGTADGSVVTGNGTFVSLNNDDSKFEITEAAIYGNGWNLSILKAAEMPKYAKGWETYNDGDDTVDLKAPYAFKNDLGVTFAMDGLFQAGFSLDANLDENAGKNVLAWAATNDLSFGGVLVNASVGFGKKASADFSYLGLGAQVGYATDTLSVKAGTDVSIGIPTEKDVDATIDADVAVNVNYADMVVADVYYATKTELAGADATLDAYQADITFEQKYVIDDLSRGFIAYSETDLIEDYVSAKVAFDMNAFDVPVKLTLAAMDVVNNPYFDLEAYAEVAGFEITGFGGYQAMINGADEIQMNNLHVGAKVAYTIEPVGKISAATTFMTMLSTEDGVDPVNAMSLEIGLENTTLVSGATLKAGYKTANIIDSDYVVQVKGKAYVSATIEF